MSEPWAHVRAHETGVSLTTVVGGISLALRHARTCARAGLTGIRFAIADQAEREHVQALFARDPAPAGLELVISDSAPFDEGLQLEASAIYLRDTLKEALAEPTAHAPKADFQIASPSTIRGANQFLFAQIRKSVTLDGVIAYYLMRPLARVFTSAVLNTRVSPNQATLAALACGLAAASCAALGSAPLALLAGLFYWMGGVLDCVDGELARLRLQSSKIGEWLDSMVDEFSTVSLVAGLGIGLFRDGAGSEWLLLGLGGAGLGVIALAPMYIHLHRRGLAIDTAQFPWFFGNSNAAEDEGVQSLFGKLINFLSYFIRRDANITGTSVLLILNLRSAALCIICGGFVITLLLVITHYGVTALRPSTSERA